ncbi:hypothetical protein JCM3765_004566 [Sporobolomyces pararoseus]
MFLCIPIICGPQSRSGEESYYCPRCGNGSAKAYKRKKWFELYWIPIVPLGSKHVYVCPVCRWEHLNDETLQLKQVTNHSGGPTQGNGPSGRGYDVAYSAQASSYPPPAPAAGKVQ